ncbi:FkbM family methyltransferase [beta proteobacterium MWH-UniP1]
MSFLHDLKVLIRSKSLDFVRAKNYSPKRRGDELYTFQWNGHSVHYRPGTSDRGLIYEILIRKSQDAEYYVAEQVSPTTIFDIGANIGITAIWLAQKYPKAKIYCFEPMPENFDLLRRNTSDFKNIETFNFGLSNSSGQFEIFPNSDVKNLGGFSLHQLRDDQDNLGTQTSPSTKIEIRDASEFIEAMKISSVDLIKIDTEGSEFSILSSIPETMLKNCQWIMGEVHGVKNFETMALLDPYFRLSFNKKQTSELFTFFGINRSC